MHTHITSDAYEGLSLEEQQALETLRLQIAHATKELVADCVKLYPGVEVAWALTIDAYPRTSEEVKVS